MCSNDNIFMARYSAFNPYRIRHSVMGYQRPIGYGDAMAKSLYCGMKPIATWMSDNVKCIPTGGVFNLEFSPEGSLLVAACEKRAIQVFDPLTHKNIYSVVGAHMDCVNCVKFLDARMFATCSDDTTIALWDIRNLKKKIRSLLGHSKWVKNIEFSVKDKLLVTSGLDGSIYTWDINSYTENSLVYQRVFHMASLMRCRLTPEAKQLVMCSTGGLIVIIHDLNLETLAQDLRGFNPNLYQLMQTTNQMIPAASSYDHLFDRTRKENRVEFVSDFPVDNDAQVVSSLQIHPHGWSALSRNISHADRSEWTCIHDIQTVNESSSKSVRDTRRDPFSRLTPGPRPVELRRRLRARLRPYRRRPGAYVSPADRPEVEAAAARDEDSSSRSSSSEREQSEDEDNPPRPPTDFQVQSRAASVRMGFPPQRGVIIANAAADAAVSRLGRGIQNDVWEASITLKQHRLIHDIYYRGQARPNFNMQRITGVNTGITPPQRFAPRPAANAAPLYPSERPSTSGHSPVSEAARANKQSIRQNRKRLLYYVKETNQGKGFIKELCYSSDGRIVCSPYGRGMRLLALNKNCSELNQAVSEHSLPRSMVEIGSSLGHHQDLVVSSKFSPRHQLLVTGCLEGRIVWYQPHSGEI